MGLGSVRAVGAFALALGVWWLACGCRRDAEPVGVPTLLPVPPTDPIGWCGWRGPNASGIASGGCRAVHFSARAGVRWKAEVPGQGNSSPVVWADYVLLTTALPGEQPPRLALLCYDRRDGRLLWQAEVGHARGRSHAKNGYASATVATDHERIYSFFGSTGLFCHDYSGQLIWRAELGDLDHMWGTAASPVVYRNLVIQLCDCETDSYVAAFDTRTGRQVWRTPRPSSGCWTTPVLVTVDAHGTPRTELVVNGTCTKQPGGGLVIAYDPDDGRELWHVRGTTELVTPTILVGEDLIYSTSGRNGPILAIRPGGAGDVTDTHVVWHHERGGPYIPTGLVYGNRLYILNDGGVLTCYDARTGKEIWRGRLRGSFTASLVAADGRIYALEEQRGRVYVVAAADAFQVIAENDLGDRILATPAIAGGELFVRTASSLFCIAGAAPPP